ncbi:MAG: glycosyltransferase family 2 protein, partial [Coxiellaceae bacterium]|nr:glycosyltransferase family 2 protein [Coxiellaceae bacterium]
TEMQKPIQSKRWQDTKLNVLIPMAGAGSRFAVAGYTFPKPLIDVNNQPMIKTVIDNLNVEANYIFIVQKAHYDKYNLKSFLNMIAPGCTIIQVDKLTDGACRTTLMAKDYINNDQPLLIANSDQYIEWESGEFFHAMNAPNIDGGILTFENTHPKWSYVNVNDRGNITELREKEVISNTATVGIYYWAKGSDYIKYAEQMIAKDIKVQGEFYVAPTYNEAIADGKVIKPYQVDRMWGLGTPEDLDYFLQHHSEVTV